ncbi:MAG: hypothetical protein Q8O57_12010, partial [Kiritimatiellota bacterium]|nr:hypothetical protein [Kiritimatiellota bacterium]
MFLDLLDTNATVVGADLFGNLMAGSNMETIVVLPVPLATNAAAATIQLRRGSGELTVYEGLLYIDEDGDGLDADQEKQLGTSDHNSDTDGDGLADGSEVASGTNPLNPDTDGDGLTDGWEVLHGLNPLNADTDGDGLNDGDEVRLGKDPAVFNQYSSVPFVEGFEMDTVQLGIIHGQNNWEAWPTNGAFVQTGIVYDGAQALCLSNNAGTEVRHLFVCSNQVVWVETAQRTDAGAAPTGTIYSAAAWFFNEDGRMVVFDGLAGMNGAWVTLTNHPPVAGWVRVAAKADYGTRLWAVYLNGTLLADNLGFSDAAPDHFTTLKMRGECGY